MPFHTRFDPLTPPSELQAERPDLVRGGDAKAAPRRVALVHGTGLAAGARITWEALIGRRKILVSISDPPRRLNLAQRLLISCADAVLATPDLVGALQQIGIAANRVVTLGQAADRTEFMACPLTRAAEDAHRMVFVGNLSLRSGATDFLSCAIVWAERHPAMTAEITWIGQGDLLGVLRAQLLPANLTQNFSDTATPAGLAEMFCRSGLLVVPSLAHSRAPWITEAMAAGLPVLGSLRSAQVRGLVVDRKTGWVFDPFSADAMSVALDAALAAPCAELDEMRAMARARIVALHSERVGEGVDLTMRARLAELLIENTLVDIKIFEDRTAKA